MVVYGIVVFVLGLASGVVITRYGIGLGMKIVYRARDEIPLDEKVQPIEQEFTDEEM